MGSESMSAYDAVAVQYSKVFDDISLRCFEWPWLRAEILNLKPDSLLDLGCGNGYLLKALKPMVPLLYGIEPCAPMFNIAQEQLGDDIQLYMTQAENLCFADNYFDAIVSLLSFRYMDWDKALSETARVLKPEGTLIIIDLFAAAFDPLKTGKYIGAWVKTHIEYAAHRKYHRKLKELSGNPDWQKMVGEFPKREYKDAKQAVEK
ncbi:MAG: class I SAM-dependent methyltransferase, partial [Treponema sp.]|nr:class I SAM-dependent methyltransferase [Treponema sp.]